MIFSNRITDCFSKGFFFFFFLMWTWLGKTNGALVKLIPSVLTLNFKVPNLKLWFSPILLDLSGFCFVLFFMQVLLINTTSVDLKKSLLPLFLSMFKFRYTQRSLSFPIRFLEGSYIFYSLLLVALIVVINKNKNNTFHSGLLHANQFM